MEMKNLEIHKKLTKEKIEEPHKNLEQNQEISPIGKDDYFRLTEIDSEISKKEQNIEETKNKIDDIRKNLGLPPSDEIPYSIQSQKDILEKLNQEKSRLSNKDIEKKQTPEELKEERRMTIIEELKKENDNLTDEGKNEIFFDYLGKGKNSIPNRAEKILSEQFPEYDGLTNEQLKEKVTAELQNAIADRQHIRKYIRGAETSGGYEEQSLIKKYTDQGLLTAEDVARIYASRGESELGVPTKEHKEKFENLHEKENKIDFENFEYPNTMREMYSAGENILSNPESTENEKMFAQKFIDQLQKEDVESIEDFNKYNEYIDQELTERFKEILKNGVLLSEQREKLNISELTEKKFDVKVLALEENFAGDNSEWQKVTGAPSMFVQRGKFNGEKIIPTIFISKNMLEQLDIDPTKLENGTNEFYDFETSKKLLQHEYRHTQRKFSSENDKLFRLIDEACTNVGSLYGKLRSVLDCLGMTTNDFDMKKIKEAYESDNDDKKSLILKQIRDNFGDMGLLLIGAKSSSEHTNDQEGIKELPLIKVNENTLEDKNYDYTDSKFLETLLELRSHNDKNWANILENNLKNKKISLAYLEDALQNYYLMSYEKLKDNPNCPKLNTFFKILSFEIQQRKV
jgi:hypothetical protein